MLDKPIFKKERKSLKAPLPRLRHCLIFYFALEQNFYKGLLLSSTLKIPPPKKGTKVTDKHGKICNLSRNQETLDLETYGHPLMSI